MLKKELLALLAPFSDDEEIVMDYDSDYCPQSPILTVTRELDQSQPGEVYYLSLNGEHRPDDEPRPAPTFEHRSLEDRAVNPHLITTQKVDELALYLAAMPPMNLMLHLAMAALDWTDFADEHIPRDCPTPTHSSQGLLYFQVFETLKKLKAAGYSHQSNPPHLECSSRPLTPGEMAALKRYFGEHGHEWTIDPETDIAEVVEDKVDEFCRRITVLTIHRTKRPWTPPVVTCFTGTQNHGDQGFYWIEQFSNET